jgi:hypothetical protein
LLQLVKKSTGFGSLAMGERYTLCTRNDRLSGERGGRYGRANLGGWLAVPSAKRTKS